MTRHDNPLIEQRIAAKLGLGWSIVEFPVIHTVAIRANSVVVENLTTVGKMTRCSNCSTSHYFT
jgi:hypothetical protein